MNTDEHRLDITIHEKAFENLYKWINNADYKGWDIFDGLNSRIFKSSPLYRFPLLRLVWIQLFKRSPINFRKISLVSKGYNAKGLGLFASGLVALGRLGEAKRLLDKLEGMTCSGYAGVSWGYNFDWQARAFFVPVGKPNMVTTAFVANAFLDYLSAPQRNGLRIPQGRDYPDEIEKQKAFHWTGSDYVDEESRRRYSKILKGAIYIR